MNQIYRILVIVLSAITVSFCARAATEVTDPYEDVVFVTNSTAWPYNAETYGNDTFERGSSESGNIDSILLALADNAELTFPDDFNFGVAHSAYQYEGNRVKPSPEYPAGIGWSIWDVFSEKGSWLNPKGTNVAQVAPTDKHTLPNGQDAIKGYSPDFYQQDMQLAKELGVKYYRISISWPRLFPHAGMDKPDPEAIKYYQTVLAELKDKGFNVLVTLYHWDLPAWLYNFGDPSIENENKTYGWLDMSDAKDNLTVKEFQKYADAVFKHFGAYTPYFSTFNEPLTFANSALYQGVHAPGKEGFELLRKTNPEVYGHNAKESDERMNYLLGANVIKAHYLAYKTFDNYRETITQQNDSKPAMLSIVLNSDWAEPYRIIEGDDGSPKYHPDDIKASKRNMDFMLGWWLDPVMFGDWPDSMKERVGNRLPNLHADTSCIADSGAAIACDENSESFAEYIQAGGALDYISLNHYTGYFAVDLDYAKEHFSADIKENAVGPNQYGGTPRSLAPGWDTDQQTFLTQFRYQKNGNSGEFVNEDKSRTFIVGRAGAQPWLRHTYFAYTKLLQYINKNYLTAGKATKQNVPYSELDIYLTENGTSLAGESQKPEDKALEDPVRIEFIKGNLTAVWDAVEQGINVKLYTYWSIADNFEWGEGYDSRFGLVWIDYSDDFKRRPKDSYRYYQKSVKQHGVASK